MKYVIGLDNGGTATKAALFDENGRELAVAGRNTPLITPKPGYTERDMEELWQINIACLREVLQKSGVSPADIAGVGLSGHGKGLYAWGKNGAPAYNGIPSTDNRAWEYPAKWQAAGIAEVLYPQLCQQLLPTQPAALLAWMKEQHPDIYKNIQWVFSVKDYIRFRLTGEAYSEVTDISGSGLLDIANVRFDKELLAALGIAEVYEKLPPLRYSYECCGAITPEVAAHTGLLAGTPVAGGMFDIDACAVAMNVTSPEQLCSITGTWTINEYISEKPVLHTEIAMNSLYALPGYYLIEDSSPTGAGNLEWVLENLFANEPLAPGQGIYQLADSLVEKTPPRQSDVYYLPFLYGTNAHPLAKASFVGLTSFHTRGDMLRAVYESAAYTAKTHIDKLLKTRPAPKALRLAGGAVNSPVWVHLFADILDMPVETVSGVKELGALGSGMAAFVAAGVYENYVEAARQMVRIDSPVLPRKEYTGLYAEKYEKYTAVKDALNAVWDKFKV